MIRNFWKIAVLPLAVSAGLTNSASSQLLTYPGFRAECLSEDRCLQEIRIDLDQDRTPEIVRLYRAELSRDDPADPREDETFVVYVHYGDGSYKTPLVGNFNRTDRLSLQSRAGRYGARCFDWDARSGCGYSWDHEGVSFALMHSRLGVFVFTGPSAYRRIVTGAKGGLSVRQFFPPRRTASRRVSRR